MIFLASAIPVEVQGNSLFGVEGLTFSGLGIWGLIAAIVIWWVRGMPERRRAANEHVTVSAAAMDALEWEGFLSKNTVIRVRLYQDEVSARDFTIREFMVEYLPQ